MASGLFSKWKNLGKGNKPPQPHHPPHHPPQPPQNGPHNPPQPNGPAPQHQPQQNPNPQHQPSGGNPFLTPAQNKKMAQANYNATMKAQQPVRTWGKRGLYTYGAALGAEHLLPEGNRVQALGETVADTIESTVGGVIDWATEKTFDPTPVKLENGNAGLVSKNGDKTDTGIPFDQYQGAAREKYEKDNNINTSPGFATTAVNFVKEHPIASIVIGLTMAIAGPKVAGGIASLVAGKAGGEFVSKIGGWVAKPIGIPLALAGGASLFGITKPLDMLAEAIDGPKHGAPKPDASQPSPPTQQTPPVQAPQQTQPGYSPTPLAQGNTLPVPPQSQPAPQAPGYDPKAHAKAVAERLKLGQPGTQVEGAAEQPATSLPLARGNQQDLTQKDREGLEALERIRNIGAGNGTEVAGSGRGR